MNRREARPKDLAAFHKVPQVGKAEIPAGVATAIRVWWRRVIGKLSVAKLDNAA